MNATTTASAGDNAQNRSDVAPVTHPVLWTKAFPDFDSMPAAIVELLNAGELVDLSYGNDAMPSFTTRQHIARVDADGSADNVPVLWVDYADETKREWDRNSGSRFFVIVQSEGEIRFESNDVSQAIAALGGAK